jgi:hypothetical protein
MSRSDQNLIINVTVNPPEIAIVGPIKENTIQKLNTILPTVCTTTNTAKTKFAFNRVENPPHWNGKLSTHFANEEIGQAQLFVTMLDALEEEGGWKLKGSNATNHDVDKVTYKFFFVRAL